MQGTKNLNFAKNTNSKFCLMHHSENGFYNRSGGCLQRGTD